MKGSHGWLRQGHAGAEGSHTRLLTGTRGDEGGAESSHTRLLTGTKGAAKDGRDGTRGTRGGTRAAKNGC